MEHGRIVKKTFEGKPEGSRRTGRPRLRWLEDVEKIFERRKWKDCDRRLQIEQSGRL
jgi:hypothetical protein